MKILPWRSNRGAAGRAPAASSRTPAIDRYGYLHLFVLSVLAVAQPLLDLLARDAEFFIVRRSSAGEILVLVVVLVVLLPLPLVTGVALAGRLAPRLGTAIHGVGVGALAALVALLTLTRLALVDGPAWWATGLALGGAFTWAYRRFAATRTLATYLGLALVVVPAVFLFDTRISKILSGRVAAELHVSGARAPVVFVIFDELSLTALLDEHHQIDAASYPHLAAFAREAYWFRNAVTVSDVTELAVPAMLTGRRPERDKLPILEDHQRNLFTALGDYKIWAVEPITRLCPPAVNTAAGGVRAPVSSLATLFSDLWVVYQHLLLPPRYAAGLPVISDRWQDFGQPAAPPPDGTAAPPDTGDFVAAALRALRRDRQEELRRLVAAFDPEEPRALYFLHVLLPHTPWEYLPSGKVYATETDRIPGLENETWRDEEAYVVQAYQRYLLQVQFLDRWLGELMARLRSLGLYDRSLIVLAADHGVSFRPGDSRRLMTATNYPDLIPVPLFIKAPHQRRGEIVDRPFSTLDVLPTVLDLLDVDPPWPFDGSSAFAAAPPRVHDRVVGKYSDLEIDESLHRDKYATLDWKLETFGSGPAILRAGTYPELYGRELDEVDQREQDTVTVRLNGATFFHRNATETTYSPAFVSGVLGTNGADAQCCDLAVAVNGTLYATVKTFGSPPDDLQFTALVPDAAFREGPNQVDVFRIRQGGPRPVLERVGSSGGVDYALVTGAEGRVQAIRRDAREWPLKPQALRGYFSTERLPQELRISGWALDLEAGAAPEQILAFYRGELVYGGSTTKIRPEVNAEMGVRETVRSAFQFDVPHSRIPESRRFGLRLFALSPAAVSELGFFYALDKDAGGRVKQILLTNGREIPVEAATLTGILESVRTEDGRLRVRGWAADLTRRETPEGILVFAGDKAVDDCRFFVARGDVAASLAMPEALLSGFELGVDLAAAEAYDPDSLLVFAVFPRGVAFLLPVFAPERLGDGSLARIRVRGGGELPIVPGALEGYVEKIVRTAGGGLRINGWAGDVGRREPAARILVLAAGEPVAESVFFVAREDVAQHFAAPELLVTGFELDLTGKLPAGVAPAELLVAAVSARGEATLLPVLDAVTEPADEIADRSP